MNALTRFAVIFELERLYSRFGENRVSEVLQQSVLSRSAASQATPESYRLWDRHRHASNRLQAWIDDFDLVTGS